jgi:hypothetical protein
VAAAEAKLEEEKREETIPTTCEFAHQSIMAVAIVLPPPWGPTPGFSAYNNQQTYYATGLHY